MTNKEKLLTCDECGCHTSEGVSVTRVKTGLGQTITRCSNHHTPETKYGADEIGRIPSYCDESEGAAVSASPQPDRKMLEAIAEDGLLVTWDKDFKFNFSQVVRLMAEFVIEHPWTDAAQEQPVENSPQESAKVLTAAQVLDASDEYCRTKGNPALAPAMRESFRKHREMPRAVLTSLNLKPVVMYETKHPSPQKGKP